MLLGLLVPCGIGGIGGRLPTPHFFSLRFLTSLGTRTLIFGLSAFGPLGVAIRHALGHAGGCLFGFEGEY